MDTLTAILVHAIHTFAVMFFVIIIYYGIIKKPTNPMTYSEIGQTCAWVALAFAGLFSLITIWF